MGVGCVGQPESWSAFCCLGISFLMQTPSQSAGCTLFPIDVKVVKAAPDYGREGWSLRV